MPYHDPNKVPHLVTALAIGAPVLNRIKALAALTGERAVKTFCQAEAALLVASGTGLLDTDWKASLSVSGMAALLSVLTTIGGDKLSSKPE